MAFPGIGIAKGMATTFRNFFSPKVTRQYPEQRPEIVAQSLDVLFDRIHFSACRLVRL